MKNNSNLTHRNAFIEYKDEELFKLYAEEEENQKRKESIRNELIKRNRPLVAYTINKYYTKPDHKKSYEDLLQEGTIGLMSAIQGYDLSLGYKFSTYATWWIRQAINNYLGNVEPLIHIPSHIRSVQNKLIKHFNEENNPNNVLPIVKTEDSLKEEKDNKQTFQELVDEGCEALQMTNKMVQSVKSAFKARKILFLDENYNNNNNNDDKPGSNFLKDNLTNDQNNIERDIDNDYLISIVEKGLEKLTPKKRLVLFLRFNVYNEREEQEMFSNLTEEKETIDEEKEI